MAVSIKRLNGCAAITAGKPMENCRLYVLDRWMQPLPVGVYGDLYVGGICVGRGYRGAPQLTEQSFFASPFEAGERIYRTGDLACWTQEGELLLAGRTDRQVKLRGLRIEPQEVAARLAAHPQVKAAAAKVLEQNGQGILGRLLYLRRTASPRGTDAVHRGIPAAVHGSFFHRPAGKTPLYRQRQSG